MEKQPAVYILASAKNGTLYVGVTCNLPRRLWQHQNDVVAGFTRRYGVHRLVYFELHEDMESAISRPPSACRSKEAGSSLSAPSNERLCYPPGPLELARNHARAPSLSSA